MFLTIIVVSVLFTKIQQAGGYPIPSSTVAGLTDVVNKIDTTHKERFSHILLATKTPDAVVYQSVQKFTIEPVFYFVSKISQYLSTTSTIANNKNPELVSSVIIDQSNKQHFFPDDKSVTPPLPEKKNETTTTSVSTDQSMNTTSVTVDDSKTTENDTVSNLDRTKRVPWKDDSSSATKGQTDDKQWFFMMLETKADRKTSTQETTEKLKWQSFWKRTNDIRFSGERASCDRQVDDKIGDNTNLKTFATIPY
ncbi:Uncharacterized protein FWK35_00021967 [Aphis craccivora]|uniref:Uncharacterized protein n=1 Tax=Aphis craccivora TaxID=307492 RepID=A0A6G0YYD0_APHCR|nr:Uncharacterized protein FWK35_00021967 [Aphis craccivora]